MARGNVQSIPTGTQTLQRTLNAEVRNAIRVLNPNDGIVYVAINGQASPVTFDFVVPSQSYAALPGPWMEYGLYFLDQSGAGRTGVVTIYETDDRLEYPDYHAIGRSLQAQVTSLDVTQGAQPSNPPTGVERIWIDSANAWGVLLGSGPTTVDFRAMIRSTGAEQIGPPTGAGTEIGYQPGAVPPLGFVQAYDRAAAQYVDLEVHGNPLALWGGSASQAGLLLDTNGFVRLKGAIVDTRSAQLTPRLRLKNLGTVGAGVSVQISDVAQDLAFVIILYGGGDSAGFALAGGNNSTVKYFGGAGWTNVLGTANTINIGWNTFFGAGAYVLQNNTGAANNFMVLTFSTG